jgi:hypothetical protein
MITKPSIGGLTLPSDVPSVLLVRFVWNWDPTVREPWQPMAVMFVLAVLFASFAAVATTALRPLFEAGSLVCGVVYTVPGRIPRGQASGLNLTIHETDHCVNTPLTSRQRWSIVTATVCTRHDK